MTGNGVIGQSGGPTSVINSSLAGVVEASINSAQIKDIYGMQYGIEGLMEDLLINLGAQPEGILRGLRRTPSSVLGSCRYKLKEADLPKVLEVLRRNNIRYFFLIGGNDTMDTINRVEQYCREEKYDLVGVGIPKTVDNDLFGTDHTPGFASAARSNILNVMQAGVLARDMKRVDSYVIYQTIGRDSGWLAAATALAGVREEEAPHLIYMPERVFDTDNFLADVEHCLEKYGWVSVVCGEGIKFSDGTPVSAALSEDKFGNFEFGAMGGASAGMNLHRMISDKLHLRGEFQITESLIMCAMDRAEANDLKEAYECGLKAVEMAEAGESGFMVSIERVANSPYRVRYGKAALKEVAVRARPMPDEYINRQGNFVSDGFYKYLRPLISELPDYIELEKRDA
ncbi:MAG: diphosphate--fructose-6-phosphate 1-phosphotransferase [Spirochaeta sp.]|nr:diphosphate--fructose-6-phosphate 1-phosphotransferase [Spirochaeta sp.]